MTKIDLEEFERRIRVRRLALEDYQPVCELQRRCFSGMKPWLPEQFESSGAHTRKRTPPGSQLAPRGRCARAHAPVPDTVRGRTRSTASARPRSR